MRIFELPSPPQTATKCAYEVSHVAKVEEKRPMALLKGSRNVPKPEAEVYDRLKLLLAGRKLPSGNSRG